MSDTRSIQGARSATRFRLADGTPARGWEPAGPGRRLSAWLLDIVLFAVTLGVGWFWWVWRTSARAATPAKAILGLMVFATDSRRPATRARMAMHGLVYQGIAVLIGLATFGLGWIYVLAPLAGKGRRTLYDEWAQAIVLARPRAT